MIDLTIENLPDYEDFFWIPDFLRWEQKIAQADLARASSELKELDEDYDHLMKKKTGLQADQMALDDQIAATEFRLTKAKTTLRLVQEQVQKLKTPSASSEQSSPVSSPDCPPV